MQTSNEVVNLFLLKQYQEISNQAKRVLKKEVPKSKVVQDEVRDQLIKLYNEFNTVLAIHWESLDNLEQNICMKQFNKVRDKVIKSFQVLNVKYKVPTSLLEKIDPLILDEDIAEDESSDNSEDKPENLHKMPLSSVEFFNLASKLVPNSFDGSVNNLRSFLDALDLLKQNSNGHENNAVAFVKTRLLGKARDLINNEQTLDEIIAKLRIEIKGESTRLLSAKLLNCRQNNKDHTSYATEIEELANKLKQAYIYEGVPSGVAENYAVEATVRSISQNANSDRAKLIVEAGNFSTTQEVIAKFINFSTSSNSGNIFHMRSNRFTRFSSQNRSFAPRNQNSANCFEVPTYGHRGRNRSYNRGRYNNFSSRGTYSNRANTSSRFFNNNNAARNNVRYMMSNESENRLSPPQDRLLGDVPNM